MAAIPTACLAAILFKVGIDILDYRILPILKRLPIIDLLVFMIVLFVTVYQDLMIAIVIGITVSFLKSFKDLRLTYNHEIMPISESAFALEQNKKELSKLPVSVLQPQGPLFFGSVESLMNLYITAPKHEILVIDMSNVTMIDLSGIYALEDLIKNLKSQNIKVFVSSANSYVKNALERMDFIKRIGKDHYKDSKKSIISIISKYPFN